MNFRALFTLIAAFFITPSLFAQNIEWEGNYGGSDKERGRSLIQSSDGGFAFVGQSKSSSGDVGGNNGFSDYWVVKLDGNGNLQWENNLGGSSGEEANSIIQTSDGGYIMAGRALSDDGDVSGSKPDSCLSVNCADYWVVKLDGNGNLQWEENFGGNHFDVANSIIQTSDGGFAVAGWTQSSTGDVGGNNGYRDYWVLKLDNNGNLEWQKNLGGNEGDYARSIVQTSDGGFAVAGESYSSDGDVGGNNGNSDYWVVKLDGNGNLQWEKNFGGSKDDEATSIIETSDGGLALAGGSSSSDGDVGGNNGNTDYWVVKIDGNGNLQWEKNFGGSKTDLARSILQTPNGGFVISGDSESSDGDVGGNKGSDDFWVLKLDGSGNIQWEENFGGSGYDRPFSLVKVSNGGYAMAGYSESSDGDVGGNNGDDDYWMIKIGVQSSVLGEEKASNSLKLEPNPTSGQLRIDLGETTEKAQLTIRDLTGRTVKSEQVENTSTFRTTIEGEAGIYFVELETANGRRKVRKVVKE